MSVSGRSVLALLVGVMLCFEIAQATYENRPAFETFCSLIRLTESKVEIPTTVRLPKDLETDLIKLNMTTADDTWYNLFSGKNEDNWEKVKEKEPFKTWAKSDESKIEEKYNAWNEAKKELLADAGKDGKKEFLRPHAGPRRQVASARIRRLTDRYSQIRLEHEGEVRKLQGLASEIEKKFRQALTGDANAENVTKDSFGDQRASGATACGSTSKTAGKSLANDLTCICTATSGSHADSKCDSKLTGGSSTGINNVAWGPGGGQSAKAGYDLVYAKCPPASTGFQPTAHALQRLLTNFWALLGKGGNTGDGSTATSYTVGGGASVVANTCTGGSNAVCVTYAANLAVDNAPGIPWLKALENALEKLEKLEAEEKKIHTLNARAESLRDAAWLDYGESKLPDPAGAASDKQTNQTGQAVPPVVAGPGGASNPGSVGKAADKAASAPRFILPWTFLI